MVFEFDEQRYSAAAWDDNAHDYRPDTDLPVHPATLPEGMKLRDVETRLDGRIDRGRALIRFLPQGYATPTWIHLVDDDKVYTLIVHPLLGRTEIVDGDVAMQRSGL